MIPRSKIVALSAAILTSALFPSASYATNYTFIGGSGLVWSGSTFWSPTGAPLTAADNVVGNTAATAITVDGSYTFGDFTPTLTGWLVRGSPTVNSSLTMDEITIAPTSATISFNFANHVSAAFTYDITARKVTLDGTSGFAPTINFGAITGSQQQLTNLSITEGISYNGAGNANFVVTNDINIGLISYTSAAGTKTMNLVNTGSINATRTITTLGISGSSSSALSIRTQNSTASAFTQTGTLVIDVASGTAYTTNAVITNGTGGAGANTVAVIKKGSGTQAFTATSGTYTGGTQINAGTLLVNNASGNAIGTGNITVATQGTLGGTGFIALTSGNTVTVSGAIAPGDGGIESLNIANDVVWNGGVAWKFELGSANSCDQLLITGAGNELLKGTGSTWGFNFQNTGVVGQTYVLIDWAGTTDFLASDFSFTGLASGLTGSFALNGSQLEFTTVAVPEPGTVALLGVGLLTVGVVFRRRLRASR